MIDSLYSIGKEELANEIHQFVRQLSDRFDLHLMDLLEIGNWGINKEGNYKLLDYGCAYELYQKFLRKSGN